jgi:hypothetical protein
MYDPAYGASAVVLVLWQPLSNRFCRVHFLIGKDRLIHFGGTGNILVRLLISYLYYQIAYKIH